MLVAGGVALGVLIGMLIPRSQKERDLLEGTGRQLADRVTGTVQAVKQAGKAEVDALLPSRDDAKERVTSLFGNIIDAAKGAAQRLEAGAPLPRGLYKPENAFGGPMSKLHLVFGGRVTDPQTLDFVDPSKLDVVGIYPDYASAENAWRSAAQRTVDDAEMRYVVVHLHRLLEPDLKG